MSEDMGTYARKKEAYKSLSINFTEKIYKTVNSLQSGLEENR